MRPLLTIELALLWARLSDLDGAVCNAVDVHRDGNLNYIHRGHAMLNGVAEVM